MLRINDSGFILEDILRELSEPSSDWRIFEYEGVLLPSLICDYNDIEQSINESSQGKGMSFQELVEFSKMNAQIINLTLVGNNYFDDNVYKNIIEEEYDDLDNVILMIDSSYWEIYSKDSNFIYKLTSKLKEYENKTDKCETSYRGNSTPLIVE